MTKQTESTMLDTPKKRTRAELLGGATGSVAIKAMSLGFGLLTTVILGRYLGPEQFGLYTVAFTVATFVGIPLLMGAPALVTREVAKMQGTQDLPELKGFLIRAIQVLAGFSLVMITLGAFVLYMLQARPPSEQLVYLLALILIPVMGALANASSALVGMRRVVLGQFPHLALRPLLLALLLVAVAVPGLVTAESSPTLAMFLNVLASVLALCLAAYFLLRALPAGLRAVRPTMKNQRGWLKSLLPLTVVAAASIIFTNVDILMLGVLEDYEGVALYRVASRGAVLLSLVLYAVNTAIAPHIAQLYAGDKLNDLQKLLSLTAMGVTALTLPVFLVFVFFGEPLIELVFGAEFGSAATALSILCVGQMVNVVVGSVGMVLNMTGHERDTARSGVFAAVLNTALNYPLILLFGIEGAAVATSLSLIVLNILLTWRLRVATGLILLPIPAHKWRRDIGKP